MTSRNLDRIRLRSAQAVVDSACLTCHNPSIQFDVDELCIQLKSDWETAAVLNVLFDPETPLSHGAQTRGSARSQPSRIYAPIAIESIFSPSKRSGVDLASPASAQSRLESGDRLRCGPLEIQPTPLHDVIILANLQDGVRMSLQFFSGTDKVSFLERLGEMIDVAEVKGHARQLQHEALRTLQRLERTTKPLVSPLTDQQLGSELAEVELEKTIRLLRTNTDVTGLIKRRAKPAHLDAVESFSSDQRLSSDERESKKSSSALHGLVDSPGPSAKKQRRRAPAQSRFSQMLEEVTPELSTSESDDDDLKNDTSDRNAGSTSEVGIGNASPESVKYHQKALLGESYSSHQDPYPHQLYRTTLPLPSGSGSTTGALRHRPHPMAHSSAGEYLGSLFSTSGESAFVVDPIRTKLSEVGREIAARKIHPPHECLQAPRPQTLHACRDVCRYCHKPGSEGETIHLETCAVRPVRCRRCGKVMEHCVMAQHQCTAPDKASSSRRQPTVETDSCSSDGFSEAIPRERAPAAQPSSSRAPAKRATSVRHADANPSSRSFLRKASAILDKATHAREAASVPARGSLRSRHRKPGTHSADSESNSSARRSAAHRPFRLRPDELLELTPLKEQQTRLKCAWCHNMVTDSHTQDTCALRKVRCKKCGSVTRQKDKERHRSSCPVRL